MLYDHSGNPVDLGTTFAGFLNNASAATGKRIIFNNVGGFGLPASANQTTIEAVYVECWEANGQVTYNDLRSVIDDGLAWGNGKPVVLAAYMDRGKTSGTFATPGVLLCDATIFASGGTHLELGDGGHMLDNEYFPNETLTLSPNLANTLTNYYNFIINYQGWLYGGLTNSGNAVSLSIPAAGVATPNKVWAFAKAGGGSNLLNLINLAGESNIAWRDDAGNYPTPRAQSNFSVKYYYGTGPINNVLLASPDINGGASAILPFTKGADSAGSYVSFAVPSLVYGDAILMESNAPPPLLLAPQLSGTNFVFSLATVSGQSYTVWGNTNLATSAWIVQTNFIGDGGTNQMSLSFSNNGPGQFFRVSAP